MGKTKKKAESGHPLPSAPQFKFGYLVHDVSRMRRTAMDYAVAPLGLTRSQWSLLATLSRSTNNGMMQAEIARIMGLGKVTTGGLVSRLETAGLVERRDDESDKRAKRVFITEKGYETIRQMIDVADPLNEEILEGISAKERKQIEDILHRVKENLREIIERHRAERRTLPKDS
ncbi:MarR family transcriptional regulator [Novosphingobium marinum]|uniref:DNA-binding MarR family transcriptional regulator n=1 Tax=Novosphingobium marinum TaxID=1514948 RepID=A0A7Y9XVE1_9SPHN|nr:MarR family transcriptional regulator [Novosphingobium marinum]NYH93968.1 DNA-binding MarR family transcriptional regulator [Novosphingobium marinum]GGC18633.1 MarR family transcriptional regulator [Novosphingobium marinum]